MNIQKYCLLTTLFFSSFTYVMDPLPQSPKQEDRENPDNRIGKKPKKVSPHIKIPIKKPGSHPVVSEKNVLSSTRSSQGKEKTVPKDAKEFQGLISARSAKIAPKKRKVHRSSIPSFDSEEFKRATDRRYTTTSEKTYTHDDVVNLLTELQYKAEAPASHRLYTIGKKKNVPLHHLPEYASLFDEIHVSPSLLAQCMYELVGEEDKKPEDYEVKQYEKISKENPEKYEELVFMLFKAFVDRAHSSESAQVMPTGLVDAHVGGYQKKIANQDETIGHSKWAILGTVMGWVLTGAGWVIQSQTTAGPNVIINGTHAS